MNPDITLLRQAKPLLQNHAKGTEWGPNGTTCLAGALRIAAGDENLRRLLTIIDKTNLPRINARLAELHFGDPDWITGREHISVQYNNHSATTDADLQALLNDTISTLEEEERYSSLPTAQPSLQVTY